MKIFVVPVLLMVLSASAAVPTITSTGNNLETLELVHILYRHGARNVIGTFPNDEHADIWEHTGFGELTNIGKQQHYELGRYIRRRYSGFLNESYDPKEVVVRSTDIDRTLMSAESNLAGLYQPIGDQIWNKDINWQPIPIHTIPNAIDYLLNPDSYCPKDDEIRKQLMNSSEVRKIEEENKGLYEFLTNVTGSKVKNLSDAGYIYDVLYIEKYNNLSMPAWLNDTVYDRLASLENLFFFYTCYTKEQQRLRGGPLLKTMLENAHDKINGKIDRRRAFFYSAHDSTIVVFLTSLGVFNNLLVPYASTVFIELHRPVNYTENEHTVKIFFRNSTTVELYEMEIPGCEVPCKLDRLQQLLTPLLPNDVVKECQVPGHMLTELPLLQRTRRHQPMT